MDDDYVYQNVHPELHPLLLQFQAIDRQFLCAVYHLNGDGGLEKIVLEFDQHSLVIETVADDDTIVFQTIPNDECGAEKGDDRSNCEPWSRYIGKKFGWGWITINQQDFLDGILLSFDGIKPQVMLNVIASSIKESLISDI